MERERFVGVTNNVGTRANFNGAFYTDLVQFQDEAGSFESTGTVSARYDLKKAANTISVKKCEQIAIIATTPAGASVQ